MVRSDAFWWSLLGGDARASAIARANATAKISGLNISGAKIPASRGLGKHGACLAGNGATDTLCRVCIVRFALVAALAAAASAPGLHAQLVLRIGAPVRVSGLDVPGSPLTGVLAGLSGDTVLIGLPGGVEAVRIPRRAITHVWGQAGRRSGAARISLLGMLVGGAAGIAIAAASTSDINGPSSPGIILGAGTIGLMLGGALGHTVLREVRWVETPLEMLDEALRTP